MTLEQYKAQLKEFIEARKNATPGPWEVNGDDYVVCMTGAYDGEDYWVSGNGKAIRDGIVGDPMEDAEFIVTAANHFARIAKDNLMLIEALENIRNRLASRNVGVDKDEGELMIGWCREALSKLRGSGGEG